jgi:hypothetical protein
VATVRRARSPSVMLWVGFRRPRIHRRVYAVTAELALQLESR